MAEVCCLTLEENLRSLQGVSEVFMRRPILALAGVGSAFKENSFG